MKKIYNIICVALLGMLAMACNEENISDLDVSGDCSVEALTLDGKYEGIINAQTRTIKVKVPVDFTAKEAMTVSTLSISKGAKANIAQGEKVNFEAPKNLHVTNGDLYLDWTINVKNDEARILSFIINGTYKASVDEATKTITAKLPASVDVTKIIPTIEVTEDAVISPKSGVATDFSDPVTYTVTDNTASETYTVIVEKVTAPEVIFLGSNGAQKMEDLCGEEQEACKWMLANVDNSMFVSWEELRNGAVDMSKCKLVWWHWQNQPTENIGDFENGAKNTAMACINVLQDHYKNGGAFILSRAAINFAAELGAVKDQLCANNCWGSSDDGGEIIGGSWDFPVKDESCYLWEGIIGGFPVKTLDANYQISNCVSQWGKWFHNDGDLNVWEEKTGCKVLAHGWDMAVTMWECPAADGTFGKGGIICFGSGCYDWYSPNPFEENFHKNMGIITGNAINHLTK